jgi:hypothetical protein
MTMSNATRRLAMLIVLSFTLHHSMYGQTTTTTTDCNVYGNTANCTSTSIDNNLRAEQQRQAFETGRQIGAALGQSMVAHASSDDDKVTASANQFAEHHKDFMRSSANAQVVATYLEANKLDPRERKSYEKAYKNLKKAGELELYAK